MNSNRIILRLILAPLLFVTVTACSLKTVKTAKQDEANDSQDDTGSSDYAIKSADIRTSVISGAENNQDGDADTEGDVADDDQADQSSEEAGVAVTPVNDNVPSFRVSDPEGPKVVDEELEAIPTEVNASVQKWITYFQGRGREHMEKYLARSTRYEKLMKKVLRDNGLPEDLFYIALIESGFSSRATSHAAAVGYWQFIRGTGKRYGLDINRLMDERRDPVLATQAAAEYFKGLYSVFGSWYLAMASYNVGENRVKREVMKHMTRDFWELARRKRLPRETVNYVPKFIAAKLIAKSPEQYGFEGIDYMPPIEFDHVNVDFPVNLRILSEKMGVNYEDFKDLNPKYRGEVAPVKNGSLVLRVPPGMVEMAVAASKESLVERVEFVADADETQTYRIRRGDTLSTIARRYRTTVAYLRDINDMPRGRKLRINARLLVPDRTPLREKRARTASVKKSSSRRQSASSSDGKFHVVQSGESLYSIAARYNTTISALRKLNNIRNGRLLRAGSRLLVPYGKDDKSKETSSSSKSQRNKIHVVRRGETISQLASRYKVSRRRILAKNKMSNPRELMAGMKLVIPR